MEGRHILLSKAVVHNKPQAQTSLENCQYQNDRGLWILEETDEVLVKSSDPNRPTPGTKKEDIETGEDLKSE